MENDKLRFRVWDDNNKKYIFNHDEICITQSGLFAIYDRPLLTVLSPFAAGIIIEQCTGLKDKNGKLIYEGDIVYDSVYENNFVVSWDNDRTGYILSANNTNHIDYLSKILIERHNLKIIGNIHEQAKQKDKK